MYEDTPNKEEIDWFEEKIQSIYSFENLKDCDLQYLKGLEWLVKNRFEIFKAGFPHQKSKVQGEMRAWINDNPNDTREALTNAEKARLRLMRKEAEVEVHRALGHRKEQRREQRNKFANAVSDMVSSIFNWLPSLPGL